MNSLAPIYLKEKLHQALKVLEPLEECILLDYPNYPNLGDHLIWLGEIFYLTEILNTKINYTAHIENFSESEIANHSSKCPILLQGGGNFGDLWYEHQKFREYIISQYPKNPIIIFPQTIYFQEHSNLIKAADILNRHPNVTIFTRDQYSYDIAIQNFQNCQVFKAPDMALQLMGLPHLLTRYSRKKSILYLCRQDKEINNDLLFDPVDIPHLVSEDWNTINNKQGWYIPLISKGSSQGKKNLNEWGSRQIWKYLQPNFYKLTNLLNSSMHLKSWLYMHQGIYQFKQHRLIITNRLHGHILCLLMGIPHVFLANSYYKNKAFYETWTSSVPFCQFVQDTSDIKLIVQELLSTF